MDARETIAYPFARRIPRPVMANMQPQDTYRHRLQQLAASIKAWSGFVADVARVEIDEKDSALRMSLTPVAAGACPIEILLDGAEPRCNLRVGGYEVRDWHIPTLDLVLPMIEAVTEGRVLARRTASATTGLPLAISTRIVLADRRVLTLPSFGDEAGLGSDRPVEGRDRHYLPYRKPAQA